MRSRTKIEHSSARSVLRLPLLTLCTNRNTYSVAQTNERENLTTRNLRNPVAIFTRALYSAPYWHVSFCADVVQLFAFLENILVLASDDGVVNTGRRSTKVMLSCKTKSQRFIMTNRHRSRLRREDTYACTPARPSTLHFHTEPPTLCL